MGEHSSLDLSRAIKEPIRKRVSGEGWSDRPYEFLDWEEIDDGRYGQLTINAELTTKFDNDPKRCSTGCGFSVQAACIEYDDYKKTWELTLEQTEYFSNGEEALDLFEELIVKNQ